MFPSAGRRLWIHQLRCGLLCLRPSQFDPWSSSLNARLVCMVNSGCAIDMKSIACTIHRLDFEGGGSGNRTWTWRNDVGVWCRRLWWVECWFNPQCGHPLSAVPDVCAGIVGVVIHDLPFAIFAAARTWAALSDATPLASARCSCVVSASRFTLR